MAGPSGLDLITLQKCDVVKARQVCSFFKKKLSIHQGMNDVIRNIFEVFSKPSGKDSLFLFHFCTRFLEQGDNLYCI